MVSFLMSGGEILLYFTPSHKGQRWIFNYTPGTARELVSLKTSQVKVHLYQENWRE